MTAPDLKISGVRKLGEALGIPKTTAAELAKQPWFPPKGLDGTWDALAVKKAYEDFKAGKLVAAPSASAPLSSTPAEAEERSSLRHTLATSRNPEEIGAATMQLVARDIAKADALSVKHVIAMKAALEELRKGAAGYLKLAQERGDLIARDVAKSVIGQLGRRGIAVLERYEVDLAGQVESWVSDPLFLAATSEERSRTVREWARAKTEDLRSIEAGQVEELVAAEVKEQAK
jgi:hypothetical protein